MNYCRGLEITLKSEDNTANISTSNPTYIYKLNNMTVKYPYIFKRLDDTVTNSEEIIKKANYSFPMRFIRMVIPFSAKQLQAYNEILKEKNE